MGSNGLAGSSSHKTRAEPALAGAKGRTSASTAVSEVSTAANATSLPASIRPQ